MTAPLLQITLFIIATTTLTTNHIMYTFLFQSDHDLPNILYKMSL